MLALAKGGGASITGGARASAALFLRFSWAKAKARARHSINSPSLLEDDRNEFLSKTF